MELFTVVDTILELLGQRPKVSIDTAQSGHLPSDNELHDMDRIDTAQSGHLQSENELDDVVLKHWYDQSALFGIIICTYT